jgi:hypothetical protein
VKTLLLGSLGSVLLLGVLSACGEEHDFLGSRGEGGGPGGGVAGTSAAPTGGASASGGRGGMASAGGRSGAAGAAGGSSGGSRATAGEVGNGGSAAESSDGGAGTAGGTGDAGEGNSGAGGAGATGGATGGNASEGGASAGGAAGTPNGGAGGGSPVCPAACMPGTNAGCLEDEVSWTCSVGFVYEDFIDGGCRDQATGLQRFCCPQEFSAGCTDPCVNLETVEECDARSDCHPVFTDPGPSGCACAAVGCCTRFSRCAEGALADCDGPALCEVMTPYCANPAYVVSYANSCFEGCVRPEDCATQ